MTKQVSVTVSPELSPRIENWLMGRDIDYEVELVRGKKQLRYKIIARTDEHQTEVFKRFLERVKRGT